MTILLLFIFLLGLTVGSFLNVCIYRIPQGESIVFPNSHCPHCGCAIRPYDNIPVISFLLLKGKCRICGNKISWQYPLVELLTATLFAGAFARIGMDVRTGVLWIFFSAIIVLIVVDLRARILPNGITLPLTLVGLIFSLIRPVGDGTARSLLGLFGWAVSNLRLLSLLDSLIGTLVCGGFLWLVAEAFFRIRKIEGLGFGDIKLMGMVGAFLGLKLALFTIMLGSLLGAIIGYAFIKLTGKDNRYELPFGSFLGVAAIIAALWGREILEWYFNLHRF
ncbi:MAG TPA: prepilin peptidase [Terriglobia bacterium]|nr:prepilin peptidase [Terriglobia bacterium]